MSGSGRGINVLANRGGIKRAIGQAKQPSNLPSTRPKTREEFPTLAESLRRTRLH